MLWFHGKSLDDEIGAVTGSDIHLVALAFAVMCAFSTLALINRDMTRSRVALSLGGVLVVALSIAAAYGLCMHMGVMFSALTQVRAR